MPKTCTFCQIARLVFISTAAVCFAGLGALSLQTGAAVPLWVIAGFLVSVVVAIWAVASYLRREQSAITAEVKARGD